ncbi:type II toxin-antitoxin system HicB family antitoxin [Microcystis protocystis FBCC-A270]|jgi:predicted RNase H-like HicB family nuclease|uniref:HicB-like antitoxin of toxin-antitoxin system domain-containing protein n=2 Tax=Microcystis TaxID=1125 RepID=A0A402DF04_MICAE|nr:type II toxin-antitoxin system HicB family antitoxin [Microcystis aeruginosa]REJ40557.1 MAG: type II toxin-antitoxin system HicB family antitoxin [Microcystis flos-aquae TF09]GCE60771.1 hypothetical protein MiAbB_02695 [Microcystis aeruginosa NIES-4285]CCI07845.1 Genome sequencing data, contig C323 (modular protein) [Microcystis aeruginosa PCC 7941]
MEQPILEYFLSLKYPISIYPEEEGGYTALIPNLPGCMSQGETLGEVIINGSSVCVMQWTGETLI